MGASIRVKTIKPLENMILLVEFENGVTKFYDTKQLLDQFPNYAKLKDETFFKGVTVDCGGIGVSWDSEIDISEVELWEGGVEDKKLADEIEDEEFCQQLYENYLKSNDKGQGVLLEEFISSNEIDCDNLDNIL